MNEDIQIQKIIKTCFQEVCKPDFRDNIERRMTSRENRIEASKFVSIISIQSLSDCRRRRPSLLTPAAFTNVSIRPKRWMIEVTVDEMLSAARTSHCNPTAGDFDGFDDEIRFAASEADDD